MKKAFTLSLPKMSVLAALTVLSCDVYAAKVMSGSIEGAELKAGVRYRHLMGSGNMCTGTSNTGPCKVALGLYTNGSLPRTAGSGGSNWWSKSACGNLIKLEYDASEATLTTKIEDTVITPDSGGICDETKRKSENQWKTFASSIKKDNNSVLNNANYMLLRLQVTSINSSIELKDVKLNNDSLDVDHFIAGTYADQNSIQLLNLTGEDLSDGFILEGRIVLTGSHPGGDNNHIEIGIGYVDQTGPEINPLSVNPSPAFLNGATTLRATVSDANTGNNTIASAEYSLNGGDWEPLAAQDGQFDEVSEDVIAELPATQLGSNEVCVRGTDSKGNTTTPATCTTFLVTYQFEGFGKPIDSGLINTAQAGQSIPARWRLTDANGMPIEDSSSFAGFYSYPIDCETATHSPHDAVEEYAPGNSGLRYQGNGQWQYNWKTPKSYWGMCRAMYIEFDSGATSPVNLFQFK